MAAGQKQPAAFHKEQVFACPGVAGFLGGVGARVVSSDISADRILASCPSGGSNAPPQGHLWRGDAVAPLDKGDGARQNICGSHCRLPVQCRDIVAAMSQCPMDRARDSRKPSVSCPPSLSPLICPGHCPRLHRLERSSLPGTPTNGQSDAWPAGRQSPWLAQASTRGSPIGFTERT